MYWPMAIARSSISEKTKSIYSYGGFVNIEDAKKQIEFWKDIQGYIIYFAYIHDDNNHIVYYENNVNSLGFVNYKNAVKNDIFEESCESIKRNGK